MHFLHALRSVLVSWNPTGDISPLCVSHFLDLVERFTPDVAHGKLFKLFELPAILNCRVPGLRGLDLRRKALDALDSYYPADIVHKSDTADADSPREVNGLIAYRRLLRAHLSIPGYEDLAGQRLNKLELTTTRGDDLEKWSARGPAHLQRELAREVSDLVVKKDEIGLGILYEQCLIRKLGGEFQSACSTVHFAWLETDDGPILQAGSHQKQVRMRMRLSPHCEQMHFTRLWNAKNSNARTKFRRIVSKKRLQPGTD
jgi:hypothetical protein